MASFEWITYKGKKILYMDIVPSGQDSQQRLNELFNILARLKNEIEKEPPKSVLSICNIKGGHGSPEVTQKLKEFTKHNEPHMKMTAIIGAEGLKKVIFNGVLLFTGRKNMVLKDTKQEALDWLVAQ